MAPGSTHHTNMDGASIATLEWVFDPMRRMADIGSGLTAGGGHDSPNHVA
jgi:hypothetical protein